MVLSFIYLFIFSIPYLWPACIIQFNVDELAVMICLDVLNLLCFLFILYLLDFIQWCSCYKAILLAEPFWFCWLMGMIKWWVIVKSSNWIHDLWKDGTYATHISPCLNSNSLRDSYLLYYSFYFLRKKNNLLKKKKRRRKFYATKEKSPEHLLSPWRKLNAISWPYFVVMVLNAISCIIILTSFVCALIIQQFGSSLFWTKEGYYYSLFLWLKIIWALILLLL